MLVQFFGRDRARAKAATWTVHNEVAILNLAFALALWALDAERRFRISGKPWLIATVGA